MKLGLFGILVLLSFTLKSQVNLKFQNKSYAEIISEIRNSDLEFSGLIINNCPDFVWDRELVKILKGVDKLTISGCNLEEVPGWLGQLRISNLDLSSNNISVLNLDIIDSIKCQNLNVSQNNINEINGKSCTSLKSIQLASCKLSNKNLLSILYLCPNLNYLWAADNPIDENLYRIEPFKTFNSVFSVHFSMTEFNTLNDSLIGMFPRLKLLKAEYLKNCSEVKIGTGYSGPVIINYISLRGAEKPLNVILGKNLDSLTTLILPRVELIENHSCSALENLVYVSNGKIRSSGCQFPDLEELSIKYNIESSIDLSSSNKLKSLSINSTNKKSDKYILGTIKTIPNNEVRVVVKLSSGSKLTKKIKRNLTKKNNIRYSILFQ